MVRVAKHECFECPAPLGNSFKRFSLPGGLSSSTLIVAGQGTEAGANDALGELLGLVMKRKFARRRETSPLQLSFRCKSGLSGIKRVKGIQPSCSAALKCI